MQLTLPYTRMMSSNLCRTCVIPVVKMHYYYVYVHSFHMHHCQYIVDTLLNTLCTLYMHYQYTTALLPVHYWNTIEYSLYITYALLALFVNYIRNISIYTTASLPVNYRHTIKYSLHIIYALSTYYCITASSSLAHYTLT